MFCQQKKYSLWLPSKFVHFTSCCVIRNTPTSFSVLMNDGMAVIGTY